jgi:acyl dehydratase
MSSTPKTQSGKLYFEDLAPGQKILSRPYELTADAIKAYAAQYDPQPFHTDDVAAQDTFFGGLAASGWQTASVMMRLIVESLPLAGGIIGASGEIAWPRPTRPGDVLQVESEILELTPSRSRPERGNAIVMLTTRNQAGEVVQTFRARLTLLRKPA